MNFCFDLDGPLIDVCDRYYRAYLESLTGTDESNGQVLSKEVFWKLKQNRISDTEIGLLSGLSVRDARNSAELRKGLSFKEEYLTLDKLFDDVYKTFDYLKSQKIPFFIVTLRRQSQLMYAVKQFKLNKYLGNERLFCRVEDQKSQGDVYEKHILFANAINKLSLNPAETWIIGDSETDILAGRLARYKGVIAITRGIRSQLQLEILRPDSLVHSLTELVNFASTVRS